MKLNPPRASKPRIIYDMVATLDHVYDGDTATFVMHHYISGVMTERCRFAGINAAELKNKDGSDNPEGIAALQFLASLLGPFQRIVMTPYRDDKGRPLVKVYNYGSAISLNDLMVQSGHAKKVTLLAQIRGTDKKV